jgi:LuxR family transcriptional regulator, maltose regulon positive regulatory protein
MAEPPASHLHARVNGPDGLLATKLYVPRPQPGFVPRPQLLDLLDQGLARGVVLVCGPAGFGKTVLLADWAGRSRHPAAWLSLDAGDNDPARLWRHVAAALDRARPGLAERVTPLLGPPPPASFEGLVSGVINELASQPGDGEVRLILDDYHVIEAHTVHTSLGFLLEHRPPGLRVVLASPADPPLSLARQRARGQLAEVRAAELRFTPEEAAGLLREAAGAALPDDAVTALAARTEGWAAGLQLAGLSLRGQPDVAAFVASFSGSHRFVLDFLAEEVLDRQPAAIREFLLHTSVLDRLSGALCDAVTGGSDGQMTLEQVEQANLFLVPLDDVRGWWRYHHLFADLLRARLQQQEPELIPQLHRRAARWSQLHGLADDAVRYALAAGDAPWTARLVEQHADEVLLRSERATLARWLAALPPDLAGSRPRLLLTRTLFSLVSGDVEQAGKLLDAAERAAGRAEAGDVTAAGEPFHPSAGRAASLIVNIPAAIALGRAFEAELRGEAEREIAFGSLALAGIGPGEDTLRAITRGHLGVADWLRGRLPGAAAALAVSRAELNAAGQRFLAVRVSEHLSQVHRAQGHLDAALGACQQALGIAAPPGHVAVPAAGIAYLAMAEVAYQRDELDDAQHYLGQGIDPCRQLVYTQPLANGLATLAWIRHAQGDTAAATAAMCEAVAVAPGAGVVSLLNPVPAQWARLLLAQGDTGAAARWAEQRGLHPDDEPGYPQEPEYLVLARILLATDHPDQALSLLQRLLASAVAQGRTGSLIELRALQARARAAWDDEAGALDALAEALALASAHGHVRVFTDEGPCMGELLSRLVAAGRAGPATGRPSVPLAYLGRLARAFRPASAPAERRRGIPGRPGRPGWP